jgi:hypothetical protein
VCAAVCGCPCVQQCTIVCGRARGYVCATVRTAVCGSVGLCVAVFGSKHRSVRAMHGVRAAVGGSAIGSVR